MQQLPFARRFVAATLAAAACLALAAPALAVETTGKTTYWLPTDVSTTGAPVDQLFNGILYLTGAVNIAVFVLLVIFLVQYRYRPGRQAKFIHGNNKLEIAWTLIPTVILALIAAVSQTTWARIKYTSQMPSHGEAIEVEVVARQFAWYTHYAGKDNKLGTRQFELISRNAKEASEQIGLDRASAGAKDDIVTPIMVIPVNRKIYIHLTSIDVIHSFFLPNFRIKQDAMPGLNGRVWIEATKTSAEVIGTVDPDNALPIEKLLGYAKPYDIVCAELCGQGHYTMRGQLYVVSEEIYEKWLQSEYKKQLDTGEEGDGGY